MIEADVYGIGKVYATLLDNDLSLWNWHPVLFSFSKVDSKGAKITIAGAEAVSKCIWGKKEVDHGMKGGLQPYANMKVGWKITDGHNQVREEVLPQDSSFFTDAEGNFYLRDVEMKKDDKIQVSVFEWDPANKIFNDNTACSDDSSFAPAPRPTCVYDKAKVVITEADFFNDYVKGYVSPTYWVDPETKETKDISYDGLVTIRLTEDYNGAKYGKEYHVRLDDKRNFILENTLEQPVNVLPQMMAEAKFDYNSFEEKSTAVKPTVDFTGERVVIPLSQRTYYEQGRQIDVTTEREMFIIRNQRGTKALTDTGTYSAEYLKWSTSWKNNIVEGLEMARNLGEQA